MVRRGHKVNSSVVATPKIRPLMNGKMVTVLVTVTGIRLPSRSGITTCSPIPKVAPMKLPTHPISTLCPTYALVMSPASAPKAFRIATVVIFRLMNP